MQIPKDVLEPVPGLSREIGLLVAGLEEIRAQTVKLIEDLTNEELSRRYLPSFHQIGALALHLGECEFWWIETVAAGKELTEENRMWAHVEDTTETDFALKGYNSRDCIDFLEKIHCRATETLARFSDAGLDNLIPCERERPRFESSLRWILHHLIDHEANHKGQIAMMKRLIREKGE